MNDSEYICPVPKDQRPLNEYRKLKKRRTFVFFVCFTRRFSKPLQNVPHVLLLKSPENRLNSMIKIFDGWEVRKEAEFRYLKGRTAIFNLLEDLLSNINEDVLAVEFSSQRIGLLWGEKDDSEAVYLELVEVLKKLKTLTEETELIYDSE